ncbi:MAG: hypothetical protein C4558_02985 [Dehalococcoidia bacterium]|nr:MAG: hypothetical protein C4558_02985 [Dehalococcoidia bacterium]
MSLRFRIAALIAAAMMVAAPSTALAHETRDVSGYKFVAGWISEPALEGQKNGIDLRITQADKPVEGVEKTLQVEITHKASGTKKTFALRTIFRDPGHYTADIIPTAPGQYEMRFFGKVGSTEVNQTFISGPGRYGDIEPTTELAFPVAAPQIREVAGSAKQALEVAQSAEDAASTARTIGIAGSVLGVLGLAAGGGALIAARRKQ